MIICQICRRECKNIKCLSSHVFNSHKLKSKDYYDLYLKKENEGICLKCGKETKFYRMSSGYNNFCSAKCSANSEETREKCKQTNIEKYNVENVFQIEEIKNKSKQTCLKKYGKEYASQSEDFRNNVENTTIKKYNVKNISQLNSIKEKKKKTYLNKYGVDHPLKNKEIKDKIKNTCLNKYGIYHYTKTDEYKEKIFKNFYNNLFNSDRLKRIIIPLFDLKDYKGIEYNYKFKCVKCNNEFEDHLDNGRVPRCFKCYPRMNTTSNIENELYEFLLTLLNADEIQRGDRNILNGLELDIYIPDFNLAIELNGLYWHSELSGKDRNYHLNKTLLCQKKGISLIHIFEDEWIEKQEVVKSIIKSKLGLIDNKIAARKCEIKEINKDEAFNFLESNHLQGFINGKHIGLYYNNELVSILTYDKSRFNNEYNIEILRFCSKLNIIVIGALSRLIKHIESDSIISYCDLRYGDGHGYEKCGFKKISKSDPSYYYLNINNYMNRLNRMQFQKHKLKDKLEVFDPNLTEWQNMQLNGYDRIWDCGALVFEKKNNYIT